MNYVKLTVCRFVMVRTTLASNIAAAKKENLLEVLVESKGLYRPHVEK